MSSLRALYAALLLAALPPVLLNAAPISAALLIAEAPAQALSAEAVGRNATAITVRIEGATQGSGVLVKREGNRYTVLTAWHVVRSQGPREELDIYTPDGKRHSVEQGSIQRLGNVDMAVLSFTSSGAYEVARVGDVKSVSSGSSIYVSGFPLPTSAVPSRLFRFLDGRVIANATVAIPNGYQLLYSNQTLPGMSGGAVLNAQGQLVGIHTSAERADQFSESTGKAVATGANQAVPIAYYSLYSSGASPVASSSQAETADDYLAQAKALSGNKGREHEVIRLSAQALALRQSLEAYFYRGNAKSDLGDHQAAIADYSKALLIDPQNDPSYYNRGIAKSRLGNYRGAIYDFDKVIAINPRYAGAYVYRGNARYSLGDMPGAISDQSKAIAIYPQHAGAFVNRGAAKSGLGDHQGAIIDYEKAIAIDPRYPLAYVNRGVSRARLGDHQGAIADYAKAIEINPQDAGAYLNRGSSRSNLGDYRSAISDYDNAITIDPHDSLAYFNRGIAKSHLGDHQGAIADYTKAIEINPQDAAFLAVRGWRRYQLGDRYSGCADIRKSASLGSTVAERLLPQVCR